MSVTIKVEGLKELEQAMMNLKGSTSRALATRVLKSVAQPIANRASALAADDPRTVQHDLHRSIKVGTRQKSGRAHRLTRAGPQEVRVYAGVTTDLHQGEHGKRGRYAAAMVNEFGSSNMPPHPFMRPAWDAEKDRLLAAIARQLGEAVARAVKRAAKKAGKV